ncbi:MAG: helix-turn-helix domain-containing protein [Bacteroidales bacterium]
MTVPLESINSMLTKLGYEWHSSEYYISLPDEYLHKDPECLPFRPDFYGLFLCVEGWMDVKINGKLIHVEPYYLFALSPDNIFQRSEESPDCKGRVLFFTKDFLLKNIVTSHQLKAFQFFTKNEDTCIQLNKEDAEPLLQLYEILKDKTNKVHLPYHHEIIRSLFFAYLFEASKIYEKGRTLVHPKLTREVELNFKFQELLVQHDKIQHNLKFYADTLFITPKYLIHAIKNASGKSPGKLIDEAIVEEAKVLLKGTSQSIAIIAEELHFSDQASFSKFFKKHTGLTPLSYRRE